MRLLTLATRFKGVFYSAVEPIDLRSIFDHLGAKALTVPLLAIHLHCDVKVYPVADRRSAPYRRLSRNYDCDNSVPRCYYQIANSRIAGDPASYL